MSEPHTLVELFGDRVLVKEIEQENETRDSLIIIPDTVQKQPSHRGEVVAVGDAFQFPVQAGDILLYGKYGGTQIQLAGEDYLILASRDVHARLHDGSQG